MFDLNKDNKVSKGKPKQVFLLLLLFQLPFLLINRCPTDDLIKIFKAMSPRYNEEMIENFIRSATNYGN